jgi:hypothetical protein
MAGFKKNQPRDKEGEWTKVAGYRKPEDAGWPKFNPNEPVGDIKGISIIHGKIHTGRSKPDYSIKPEQRGKPRTLFQQVKTKSYTEQSQKLPRVFPAKKAQLVSEKKAKAREMMQGRVLHSDLAKAIMKEVAPQRKEALIAKRVDEALKSGKSLTKELYQAIISSATKEATNKGFSNVPKTTSRMNRNIGKAPKGLRTFDPSLSKKSGGQGKLAYYRPETAVKVKKIIRGAETHRAELTSEQRHARATRDAFTNYVLKNPTKVAYYKVGGGEHFTVHPRGVKAVRTTHSMIGKAHRLLGKIHKWW